MFSNVMLSGGKTPFEPKMIALALQDESSYTTHVFQLRKHEVERIIKLLQELLAELED